MFAMVIVCDWYSLEKLQR
ncbi:hypothetical protein B4U80_08640 [Leptotrombidium deliense]|uniref:Uncharacterized protein n=1 Tax=Leptotrombidium deliense TaxID=299467 RepID=A0A443S0R5_9ACAR|nr:hypothetical protein B4U80_08640 [Leptotrombidium deliense]